MCIFGHKFGPMDVNRIQYCIRCGKANQVPIPHPCASGHVWVDEYTQQYKNTYTDGLTGARREITSITYFQKCKICGHKRSIEI